MWGSVPRKERAARGADLLQGLLVLVPGVSLGV